MSTMAIVHPPGRDRGSPAVAVEQLYRAHVDAVSGYFSRRCPDPQTAADLTSETFLRAIDGLAGFDDRRGSHRSWLFGIAAHVYAHHYGRVVGWREAAARLGGRRPPATDELEELIERIDAEREVTTLLDCCAQLPERDREAIELVGVRGLSPKEAALTLGVPRGVFRKRLSRARNRLHAERVRRTQPGAMGGR